MSFGSEALGRAETFPHVGPQPKTMTPAFWVRPKPPVLGERWLERTPSAADSTSMSTHAGVATADWSGVRLASLSCAFAGLADTSPGYFVARGPPNMTGITIARLAGSPRTSSQAGSLPGTGRRYARGSGDRAILDGRKAADGVTWAGRSPRPSPACRCTIHCCAGFAGPLNSGRMRRSRLQPKLPTSGLDRSISIRPTIGALLRPCRPRPSLTCQPLLLLISTRNRRRKPRRNG